MKILGFTHIYPRTATDNLGVYIRQLYTRLASRHEIRVLVPRSPRMQPPPLVRGTPEVIPFSYGVPLRWSKFSEGAGLDGEQRLNRKVAALAPLVAIAGGTRLWNVRRDADLVHAHFLVPLGAIAAAVSGSKPLFISLHGSDVYLAERSKVVRQAARFAIERASAIVPCSEDLGRRVIELGADPGKVHVVPYGADPAIFGRPPDPAKREAIRRAAGAGDRPLVLFLGNLFPKKGVTHLIDAAVHVRAKVPDAQIVIAGEGPLRASLEAQAASLGLAESTVRFMGRIEWSTVPDWYAASDVFVVPSVIDAAGNVDGLPNVVLEAMACELPVVASDVAGIPQVIRDRDTGRLVKPGDPEALGGAIVEMLVDRPFAKSCGVRARAFIRTELTWERAAERYEVLFERYAGDSRSQRVVA